MQSCATAISARRIKEEPGHEPKSELARTWFQKLGCIQRGDRMSRAYTHDFVLTVHVCELLGDFLGTIRAGIVDDDDFPC